MILTLTEDMRASDIVTFQFTDRKDIQSVTGGLPDESVVYNIGSHVCDDSIGGVSVTEYKIAGKLKNDCKIFKQ